MNKAAHEQLRDAIKDGHDWFQRWAHQNRYTAFAIRVGTALLAAATTVLLGLNAPHWEVTLKNIALVLSALIAVLNVCDAFYKPRATWINAQLTADKLDDLLRELDYALAPQSTEPINTDLERFRTGFNKILEEHRKWWKDTLREANPDSSKT